MILADTSLWVEHFRRGLPSFAAALRDGRISIHPVVLGELASGNLANRLQTLTLLKNLPRTKALSAEECLAFIESHGLYGKGIGWNDLQLLAAAHVSGHRLWFLDQRLQVAAYGMGVALE